MIFDDIVITKLLDVMTISNDSGVVWQCKSRRCYALTFCASKDGFLTYDMDGKTYCSDYNHAVLLPMGRTYTMRGIKNGEYPLINFDCLEPLNDNQFAVFDISSPELYLGLYEQIRTLCMYRQPFCDAKAIGLFYELLSHLMVNSNSAEASLLSTAMKYIEENYVDPDLTVEKVTDFVHVSPGYFRRVFKEQYSISPKRFILNMRMTKAKELLLAGIRPPMSEVAARSGFTNIYHFGRTFKEFYGCSPTEYAQKSANPM